MSTSSSKTPYASTSKRKKPPACDFCKSHRVLCHPQPPGISCPRCFEKGVECTTTPVTRRRRRTKAEVMQSRMEAAAASRDNAGSGSLAVNTPLSGHSDDSEPSSSQYQTPSHLDSGLVPALWSLVQRNSLGLTTLTPPGLDLPASLVIELFRSFRDVPQFHHPLMPYKRLESTLQQSSGQLSQLPPQDRVLVQCILAVSSLSSMDLHIIGAGNCSVEDVDLVSSRPLMVHNADLREYGRRRESMCRKLREDAVRSATIEGVTINVSQENAASCVLLDFLQYHATGQGITPFASAYTAHLRSMQETPGLTLSIDTGDMLRWSSFLMQHALMALLSGKSIPFTKHDQRLICGEEPRSLEEALKILLSDDATPGDFFLQLHPLSLYISDLARENSERLTGAYARRQPFDEAALIIHLSSLDTLYRVVGAFKNRADVLVSNEKDTTRAHFIRLCKFGVVSMWASLILPIYGDLEHRCSAYSSSASTTSTSGDSAQAEVAGGGGGVAPVGGVVDEAEERSRARIELSFLQVRKTALKAAIEVAECLTAVPSIHRLTHINYTDIHRWARLLLTTMDVDEVSTLERALALERFRDALKLAGFSWVDRTGLIEVIEARLSDIAVGFEQGFFSVLNAVTAGPSPDDHEQSLMTSGLLTLNTLNNSGFTIEDYTTLNI